MTLTFTKRLRDISNNNNMKDSIFTSDILAHVPAYLKYGKEFTELFFYFNQFSSEGIIFPFHVIPRHTITREDAEKVIKEWKLKGDAAKEWRDRVGGSIAYQ